ncbi:DNA adenine methylase [Corynebacterium sp. MSK158]|uniref:DNA adenine methylase n=1 Tax=Corynebacterium sp. MSK158 TaxID=3050212 RepID=UPI00254C6900|nr:DNA adenine methylase [Corynebacterium sp. MSK158]MDK8693606.1 DNA adenine methylase [Corynebacterium sp. MSK158]
MTTEPLKAPFPYFGGKRRVAPKVWQILGDVGNYVEPFCGSMAVLLARPPHHKGITETVNDADGWLINAWRAIQLDPETTSLHAAGPVSEVDYHAQLAWLQSHRDEYISWLEGDPEHYDPKLAGWWLRVIAAGVGDPFGPGPWHVVDGHLVKSQRGESGVNRGLPHLGTSGAGVNRQLNPTPDSTKQQKIHHYLNTLSRRIENTRITCGDWRRVLTNTPLHAGKPTHQVGVFLDPPYEVSGNLYAVTNHSKTTTISQEVRAWCRDEAPVDQGIKIILCGYENEHDELLQHGWHKTVGAHTAGGYVKDKTRAGKTEQLWLSPACEDPDKAGTLF